jgi:4-oxalocrotonate tautomerase
MPHVTVKMFPGRSEAQKQRIAEAITQAVIATAECAETSVSVSIEDVESADWTEKVYKPDIVGQWERVYKKPGYDPL